MRNKCLARLTAVTLVISVLFSSITVHATENDAQTTETSTTTYNTDAYVNEMIENNYTNISKGYSAPRYSGEPVEITVDQAYESGSGKLTADNYSYKNQVVNMTMGDTAVFTVEVPKTAQYIYRFDYLSYDESILPVELSMQINGEYPFYEARRLLFESKWVSDTEKAYDRYNNEIVTIPNKVIEWESKYLMDASYRHSNPLIIVLNEGTNKITLDLSEGNVLIGNMYLERIQETPEYTASEKAVGAEMITIEAEDFTYRNDSSIRAVSEFEADLTPYEVTDTVLNTIDKDSFKDAGQKVTYEFPVTKAGYYYIALNYKQNDKNDFPVFTDVTIDGALPNTEYTSYPLMYTTNYKTVSLKDDEGEYLSVYLEEGTHTIALTINIDNISHVLEAVSRITSEINDLSLEITKVAGTNKDKYRDLKLTSYIPDVQDKLYGWVDELEALRESCKQYNPKVKKIAAFSQISVATNQLKSLAKEPDELPYRVGELVTSISSVNTCLANLLDTLNKNRLSVDRIFLYQEDAKLPAKTGFFKQIYLSVKRFVASFFDQAYSTSNIDEEHIQVWVNRSRQYLEVMQKMIDEQFTPQTGIEVDLSLMPDQYKLVLANSSGDAPDIATGVKYEQPFELGIRGAAKDLTDFDDFTEIAKQYEEGLLVPATIGDGVYALPETMNFWVLFYRSDIMEKLGLEVPNTMVDVIDMLPELQMRGLNFFYPTAAMLAMRNFWGTTPLIYQNGGALYAENGECALNSEESIEGITMLTELFTIYNMPIDIPNFYQHFRNGDLPLGISDYSTYNMLLNAAPEIANSWDIALIPGVEKENGEVVRYAGGGAESTIMFKSTEAREAQAWNFMKWWSSTEVQTEFGQTLQITYGDEYLWTSANLEAFNSLPWSNSDKQIIAEQSTWIMETPRILGSYMMERELSNSFNDIVVNGKTLRLRIDKAAKSINRETERKLEEFGYIDEAGTVLKEFKVPDIDTVIDILESAN